MSAIGKTSATGDIERRAFQRVQGPFEGRRVGVLETPVSIYTISEGGCFIHSTHEQRVGVPIRLKIDLPHVGWIAVMAHTLYRQHEYGFAVRFVDVPEETAKRLHQALERLRKSPPGH